MTLTPDTAPVPPETADTVWLESPTTVSELPPGTRVTDRDGVSYRYNKYHLWQVELPWLRPSNQVSMNSWAMLYHYGPVRVTETIPTATDVVRQVMADAHNIPQDLFADEILARLTAYGYMKEL